MVEQWREWWGKGTIPTGFVEVQDAGGRTSQGSASGFQWSVVGHRDDIRYWRPAKNPAHGYRSEYR